MHLLGMYGMSLEKKRSWLSVKEGMRDRYESTHVFVRTCNHSHNKYGENWYSRTWWPRAVYCMVPHDRNRIPYVRIE